MILRFRYRVAGGHTHVRVFAGIDGVSSVGKCGDLCFRNEEWECFMRMCPRATFLDEGAEPQETDKQ